jgi:hypothetical protein
LTSAVAAMRVADDDVVISGFLMVSRSMLIPQRTCLGVADEKHRRRRRGGSGTNPKAPPLQASTHRRPRGRPNLADLLVSSGSLAAQAA